MARPTFRHRGLFWLHAPKSWSGTFPILKLFQGTPENLGEMVSHTFYVHEQRNKVKKVFEVSFKIAVSLMLHGHNSFNEVFKKTNCCELLLRNVVNCISTCMASQNNSVLEVCQTQYFWILPVWPHETNKASVTLTMQEGEGVWVGVYDSE